jgi:hypothetical protein
MTPPTNQIENDKDIPHQQTGDYLSFGHNNNNNSFMVDHQPFV